MKIRALMSIKLNWSPLTPPSSLPPYLSPTQERAKLHRKPSSLSDSSLPVHIISLLSYGSLLPTLAPLPTSRVVLDSLFNMQASQVSCDLSFNWEWRQPTLGIEGSGDGVLSLKDGSITYVFDILKVQPLPSHLYFQTSHHHYPPKDLSLKISP